MQSDKGINLPNTELHLSRWMKINPYLPLRDFFDNILLLKNLIYFKQTIKPGIISILVLTSSDRINKFRYAHAYRNFVV